MNFKYTLLAGVIVFTFAVAPLVHAQDEDADALAETVGDTVGIDVGFSIPSPDEVRAIRDRRPSQAVSERVGRNIMEAFELYEEDLTQEAIQVLRGTNARNDFDRAYLARFIGNLLASEDELDEAIAQLERAVDFNILSFGDHGASIRLLADLNLQHENYEEALQRYQEWIQFTGELDHEVFMRMANAHLELENYEQVIPFARKSVAHQETPNRNPYILQVAAFYETQQIANAIQVLEEGLEVLPGEERWWGQLGMFYLLEEELEKALATMELAYLAGYLNRENDFRALVQMYSNLGIPYRAATVMERHIESGEVQGTPRNYSIAARSYHSAREFNEAAEMYTQAIAVAEDDEDRRDYYRRRGDALLFVDRYSNAAEAFSNAIQLMDPDDDTTGRLYMSLAEAYFYAEQYGDALAAAENATRYDAHRRNAESWAGYIRTTAERRGVDLD
ncbi:hypothetical protein CWE09_05655 [Aliidiomarina minuta]|uniref:Uncharacterized protein n=1 Tax=Aliidiomarina minuta TaxID=880057 RepID=A0A432W856_9GAMM|nr:tetratricopeptide repeat protein [Aliidiomarina minuta]RUO26201.1 hypothetical protein CWE09_05655 [Aliidiomarina minuta]